MALIYGIADSERQLLNKLPNEVQDIDDMGRVKKEFENKLANEGSGFFAGIRKWNYKRQVDKFEKSEVKLFQKGTRGENEVIDELSKLDDSYHILCGVDMELDYWVTYNGRKNLKSAQMDLIVVCPKGIFMIEVKNWSNQFANNNSNNNFSPYEQTERAGRVLWISLQKVIKNVRVTNILLSIKGNLPYNESYRSVYVSSLDKINNFLEKRQDEFNKNEVEKIVKSLNGFVTK
tara:strand:+ start:121 stop:819 length:699 start_codon:yes stop_codon:yes gene_type:complete